MFNFLKKVEKPVQVQTSVERRQHERYVSTLVQGALAADNPGNITVATVAKIALDTNPTGVVSVTRQTCRDLSRKHPIVDGDISSVVSLAAEAADHAGIRVDKITPSDPALLNQKSLPRNVRRKISTPGSVNSSNTLIVATDDGRLGFFVPASGEDPNLLAAKVNKPHVMIQFKQK